MRGCRQKFLLLGSPAELFFWRTRAQSEVDLVMKQSERPASI